MNILITGGTGFLGKHLTQFLFEKDFQVISLGSDDCDLTDRESLSKYSHIKFDLIFHLAAWTQAGDFCLKHPGDQWILNQQINTNVLNWWLKAQPFAKLIIMGTSCSYDPRLPHLEENYLLGEPTVSLYTYAMTKRMLLQGVRALQKQYGLTYFCAVPSTLYGAGYHQDGRQMHFIFDLIRKIIRGHELGEKVVLWGDGYQTREIVEVNDFINLLWKLSNSLQNDIVNIGAGSEFSIRHFAKIISDVIGYRFEDIEFDESKYVGAKSKCLQITKARNLLKNDYKLTDMRCGIRKTTEWFYENKAY